MFYQLKRKWKVDAVQLSLILCTFAVGGSLTGFTGKKLMQFIPVDHPAYWWIIYVVIISILWPLSILLTSLPLGQFRFFKPI